MLLYILNNKALIKGDYIMVVPGPFPFLLLDEEFFEDNYEISLEKF